MGLKTDLSWCGTIDTASALTFHSTGVPHFEKESTPQPHFECFVLSSANRHFGAKSQKKRIRGEAHSATGGRLNFSLGWRHFLQIASPEHRPPCNAPRPHHYIRSHILKVRKQSRAKQRIARSTAPHRRPRHRSPHFC